MLWNAKVHNTSETWWRDNYTDCNTSLHNANIWRASGHFLFLTESWLKKKNTESWLIMSETSQLTSGLTPSVSGPDRMLWIKRVTWLLGQAASSPLSCPTACQGGYNQSVQMLMIVSLNEAWCAHWLSYPYCYWDSVRGHDTCTSAGHWIKTISPSNHSFPTSCPPSACMETDPRLFIEHHVRMASRSFEGN